MYVTSTPLVPITEALKLLTIIDYYYYEHQDELINKCTFSLFVLLQPCGL